MDIQKDPPKTIRVLVVDDSAFMRKTISSILNSADDIEVVATARDGMDAIQKVTDYHPDVMTMDVEMPRLDGLQTLGYIMSECPTPVVMLSAYTEKGGEMTIRALEYGAVDFICKPSGPISLDLPKISDELINKVRMASYVDVTRLKFMEYEKYPKVTAIPSPRIKGQQIVVIGSSTGGPRALYEVIPKLPADFPAPVLVVQHMAAGFTKSLAERMSRISNLQVKEAEGGEKPEVGKVYIAPSNYHMILADEKQEMVIRLHQGPTRNSVRPSVDATLESVAKIYRANCLAVILTGMGHDGTEGCHEVKHYGGNVMVEDKSTCVVFGMPRSVIEAGLADSVWPINVMADEIQKMIAIKKKQQ